MLVEFSRVGHRTVTDVSQESAAADHTQPCVVTLCFLSIFFVMFVCCVCFSCLGCVCGVSGAWSSRISFTSKGTVRGTKRNNSAATDQQQKPNKEGNEQKEEKKRRKEQREKTRRNSNSPLSTSSYFGSHSLTRLSLEYFALPPARCADRLDSTRLDLFRFARRVPVRPIHRCLTHQPVPSPPRRVRLPHLTPSTAPPLTLTLLHHCQATHSR